MRFFIRDSKNNWFKRLIFFYIALGIVIAIHKGVKVPPTQHQSKQAQDQTLRVKTPVNNSVSDKLQAQKNNYPPQLLFDTPDLTGQAEITSGVTFSLITLIDEPGRSRIVRHIRLYGVDTCEPRQPAIYNNLKWPCGAVATAWLVSRTFNKILFCRASTVRSGVHYAQCTVDGKDLAALGLAAGMMITTTKADFPLPKQYYEIEKIAKENKMGIWSSQFINPDKWRVDNGNYNPFDPR